MELADLDCSYKNLDKEENEEKIEECWEDSKVCRKFFLVWESSSTANIHRKKGGKTSKKEEGENAHEEETNSRDCRRSLGKEEAIRWTRNNRGQKIDRQDLHLTSGISKIVGIGNRAFSLITELSLCPCLCNAGTKERCRFLDYDEGLGAGIFTGSSTWVISYVSSGERGWQSCQQVVKYLNKFCG